MATLFPPQRYWASIVEVSIPTISISSDTICSSYSSVKLKGKYNNFWSTLRYGSLLGDFKPVSFSQCNLHLHVVITGMRDDLHPGCS